MQAQTPEVGVEQATTAAEHRLVSVEQLKKIHRDLDACQKVIWLAGCRPRGYGFDPSYVTDAQERLKEIELLLAESAPQAPKMPAQVTAAMWRAAHDSMELDGDLALALQEALIAAPQSGQTDRWQSVTKPGQIEVGDWLSFTVAECLICAKARDVLNPGTDREEVIMRAALSVQGGA